MEIRFVNVSDYRITKLKDYISEQSTPSYSVICNRLGVDGGQLWDILQKTGRVITGTSMFGKIVSVQIINCHDVTIRFVSRCYTRENNNVVVDVEKFREATMEDDEMKNRYMDFPKVSKATNPTSVPDILKVEFFDQGLPTIKVTFFDGTHTTATCKENDVFDFDVGLGICLAKRAVGPKFNRMIEKAHKLYIRQKEAKLKAAMEHEEKAKREIRKAQKKVQKTARKEAEWRQEQIDILAQAIKKAREDSGSEEVTHKDVFKIAASMIKKADDRKDRNKKILELRAQGKTYKEIAKELHVSKSTIGEVIREANKQ